MKRGMATVENPDNSGTNKQTATARVSTIFVPTCVLLEANQGRKTTRDVIPQLSVPSRPGPGGIEPVRQASAATQ